MASINRTIRISRYDAIVLLIAIYSFTTLTQNLYPISINRFITALIAVLLIISRKKNKREYLLLGYLAGVLLYTSLLATKTSTNMNDFIYFSVAVVQLAFFVHESRWDAFYKAYKKNHMIITSIAVIDLAIIIVSLIRPDSYVQHWGGESYLYGFTDSGHAMAASCCLAMSIMLLQLIEKRFSLFHLAIMGLYAIAILETGARVFLVPMAILLYYYMQRKIASWQIRWGVYAISAIGFIYMFRDSNMMQKFIVTIQDPYNNASTLMESLTNGRSNFWLAELKDFASSNIFSQLFGHGFDYIYQFNLKTVGMEIWAHNDFINLLIALGGVGVSVYFCLLVKLLKCLFSWNNRVNSFLIILYVFFPALINGFYSYYHYLCSFFIFALVTYINSKDIKGTVKNEY